MIDFANQTALVTGAAQGIGAEIARALHNLAATVALVDVDEEAAGQLAAALDGAKRRARAYGGDVRDGRFLNGVVRDVVGEWGGLDILVNNAGIIRDNLVEKISEDDWDAVLDVNLKGAFLACQAVVPHMKERRHGKIVNIISHSALGKIGQANYAASKGGLASLTRTLALELARDGIQVNGVAPGLIDTPMTRSLPDRVRERLVRSQPTGRMGTVADVADAVCFLASERAAFITGQILYVDGGKSCGSLSP